MGFDMNQERQRHLAQCIVDTSEEYFEIRVRQCDHVEVLRKAVELEVDGPCRSDRVGYVNTRIMELS